MADRLPVLHGERLVLRPGTADDVPALTAILAEPEVLAWWGEHSEERVRREIDGTFAIIVDGAVVGWMEVDETDDPDFPNVAFDIAVTTRLRGLGYGREALRVAIRHYIAKGHHRFSIDPSVENARAIRAYEAVGFRRVGVLRRYERAPDGRWRDGLLMDLLAEELR